MHNLVAWNFLIWSASELIYSRIEQPTAFLLSSQLIRYPKAPLRWYQYDDGKPDPDRLKIVAFYFNHLLPITLDAQAKYREERSVTVTKNRRVKWMVPLRSFVARKKHE